MVAPYEPYVAVCERLNALTPGDHEKATALFNSGSEAVENAVKIARIATGRQAVVVLDNAYHGRTNLTLAMTAQSARFKQGFGPYAPEIYRVPGSYPLRDGLSDEQAARRTICAIEDFVGSGQAAAIVAEPIAGEGGAVPAPGYVAALARYARSAGILFVADEVQSGIARTGAWFAIEHEAVVPDLLVVAKGVAGGLPLSAVTGRRDLMDAVAPGGLGGTFGGNPVACAAALASLETIEADGLIDRAAKIEVVVREILGPLVTHTDRVAEVRGRGAMMGVEMVTPDDAYDANLCTGVIARCHQAGVIVMPAGPGRNILRLLPPLAIDDALLREGLRELADAVRLEFALR